MVPCYYKKMKIKKKCIMKTKRPFVKIVLFNEIINLFKPNFDIGRFFESFKCFRYPYYLISTTFHNSHAIKVAPHR